MDRGSIELAAGLVKQGRLVVYPTDTVYGLGCDPTSDSAVDLLFEAKRRDTKPVPILCSDAESAFRLVALGPSGRSLASTYWPGPLTIVGRLKGGVAPRLHQGTGTIGVRVPDHTLCRELIRICGGSLTGTSANISGERSAVRAEDAAVQIGDSVDLILDGGVLSGIPSTVVSESDDGLTILRSGPVRVPDEMMRRRTSL